MRAKPLKQNFNPNMSANGRLVGSSKIFPRKAGIHNKEFNPCFAGISKIKLASSAPKELTGADAF
jgi:hypothetical protein